MRDFCVKGLESTATVQSRKIAIQRTDHNETAKQVAAINKSLEEDIHKQIKELNDLTSEHVTTLEFMKND